MFMESERMERFYKELEPEKRKLLLDEILEQETDDGVNAYRKRLFELRCIDPKNPDVMVDRMLWQCLNLTEVYNAHYLFKRSARSEIRKELGNLGYYEADRYGEAGERALYREVQNAASRYLKTCTDPGYRRMLFGLVSSSDRDRRHQVCLDIWKMTEGICGKYDMGEELAVWSKAVQDQYYREMPEGRSLMDTVRKEQ